MSRPGVNMRSRILTSLTQVFDSLFFSSSSNQEIGPNRQSSCQRSSVYQPALPTIPPSPFDKLLVIMGRKSASKRSKKALKAQQQITDEFLASVYGPGNGGMDDGTNARSSPVSERTGDEVSRVGRGNLSGDISALAGRYRNPNDDKKDSDTELTSDDDGVEVIEQKNNDPWSTFSTQGSSFSPPLVFSEDYQQVSSKDLEKRDAAVLAYTNNPLRSIKNLQECGFGPDSWYNHCFFLAELLSLDFLSMTSAWQQATEHCRTIADHKNINSIRTFYTSCTPENIFKLSIFDPQLRVCLALTWGAYKEYVESCKRGDDSISLRHAMDSFVQPATIPTYIESKVTEMGAQPFEDLFSSPANQATARAVRFSDPGESSSDNAAYIKKGFLPMSNYMPNEVGSTGPTWTEVKQAFVSKFASNFLWFGISEKLKCNDMAKIKEERDLLIEKISLDKYKYMFHNFKTDVYAELSQYRPQVMMNQALDMGLIDFYATWKGAFIGDTDTMIRLAKGKEDLCKIDLNVGVAEGTKKFYVLKEKFLNDWNAVPQLAKKSPHWMFLYSFLYKPVTLAGLVPIFQSFMDSLRDVIDDAEIERRLEKFVAKLAAEASTYDQQLQVTFDNSDTRRQPAAAKVIYKAPSDLPEWDAFVISKKRTPIPKEVWSQMHQDLRQQFLRTKVKKRKTKRSAEDGGGDAKFSKEDVKNLIADAIRINNEQNGIVTRTPSVPEL